METTLGRNLTVKGGREMEGELEAHVCRGKGFGGGAAGLCV